MLNFLLCVFFFVCVKIYLKNAASRQQSVKREHVNRLQNKNTSTDVKCVVLYQCIFCYIFIFQKNINCFQNSITRKKKNRKMQSYNKYQCLKDEMDNFDEHKQKHRKEDNKSASTESIGPCSNEVVGKVFVIEEDLEEEDNKSASTESIGCSNASIIFSDYGDDRWYDEHELDDLCIEDKWCLFSVDHANKRRVKSIAQCSRENTSIFDFFKQSVLDIWPSFVLDAAIKKMVEKYYLPAVDDMYECESKLSAFELNEIVDFLKQIVYKRSLDEIVVQVKKIFNPKLYNLCFYFVEQILNGNKNITNIVKIYDSEQLLTNWYKKNRFFKRMYIQQWPITILDIVDFFATCNDDDDRSSIKFYIF